MTAFRPDGRRVATGSADETIRIWDLATGRSVQTLAGHTEHVTSLAFAPDGRRLASSSPDRTVRVWDLDKGVASFQVTPDCYAGEVTFSRDGSLLIYSCPSGEGDDGAGFEVRSAVDGSLVRRIASGWGQHRHLVTMPDGSMVAAAIQEGCDTTLIDSFVWNVDIGTQSKHLGVSAEAISPDGRRIASTEHGEDGTSITIHDVATGKALRTLDAPDAELGPLAFDSDGSRLLAGFRVQEPSPHSTMIVWDTASGEEVLELPDVKEDIETISISPDGKHVVTSGGWRSMIVWDLPSATVVRRIAGTPINGGALAFDREGRLLVSGDDGLHIWNAASGEEVGSVPGVGGYSLVVSADGNWLAGNPAGNIRVWSTKDWTPAALSPPGGANIWWFAFRPAPGVPAIGSLGNVSNWQIAGGQEVLVGSSEAKGISRDGKLLADRWRQVGEVGVWNLETSALLASFVAPLWVHRLEFSPDGKLLLTTGAEAIAADRRTTATGIQLWDVATWTVVASFSRTSWGVTPVEFSSDGRVLAIPNADGTTELYDIASRRTLRALFTGEIPGGAMAFSRDGEWFAAMTSKGAAVWNLGGAGL